MSKVRFGAHDAETPLDAEKRERTAAEVTLIVGDSRRRMLMAQLLDTQRLVREAAPPAPSIEEPAVTQARRIRVTRKAPEKRAPALDELSPAARWKRFGIPFKGKRQQERERRQAARLRGCVDGTNRAGINLATNAALKAMAQDAIDRARKNDAKSDLMACPSCNQYNQRTNYACRVCGFEFGFST